MLIKGSSRLPQNTRNILVIQLGDLGDVVLTIPTLRALRENFPGSRLVVVLREKARGLLEGSPWVAEVVYVSKKKRNVPEELAYQVTFFSKLRKHHFDVSFDLRTGTRGAFLSLLSGARIKVGRFNSNGRFWRERIFTHVVYPPDELNEHAVKRYINVILPFGLKIGSLEPELVVSRERMEKAYALLRHEGLEPEKPIVAVHPFSLWKYKEWQSDQWVSLIDYLAREYAFPVIITGSAEERSRAAGIIEKCKGKAFNLAGTTSVAELAALLKISGLVISVDTVALHVGAAVGTPTLGIFGPTPASVWAPIGKNHRVVQKDMPCVPCRQKGCGDSETSLCLQNLSFAEIREALDETLHHLRTAAGA
ncbi:MAG: glycosyltransferase family 9 protein [Deltaproteobacteria bacterium]|nr:glycosyltransferase family 9 protein [Deltaproteobacteria bacterium]